MNHFNHREEGEFGDGATVRSLARAIAAKAVVDAYQEKNGMLPIPKRRGWEITGYAILAGAVIASIFALVIASAP